MKRWMCLIPIFGVAIAWSGCAQQVDPWPANKSPRLLATFPPICCFVKNVADDDAAVLPLLTTVGPHDFQPSVADMLMARRADVLFTNGLDIDDKVASDMHRHSGNPNLVVVNLGAGLKSKIPFDKKEAKKEDHHGHSHGGEFDPHVWLGIPEAMAMVDTVRDQLSTKYPDKAKIYAKNAAAYVKQLEDLHKEGKAAMASAKPENRKIIAFHDSLRYFARSFDLTIAGVIETKPGQPPSPAEFNELVKLCKEQNVRLIAVEPQYPPDVAKRLVESIAKEGVSGVKIVEIDPLETALPEDFTAAHQNGKDLYIRKMQQNIDNLVKELR